MRIGQLAKRAGVSVQTFRYYERRRLMRTPRRTAAGYRIYVDRDLETVALTKKMQRFGFSLAGTRTATLAEDLESAKEWYQAPPDAACTVGKLVAEGDLVTASWTCRGTNTGTGHGLPATGKAVAVSGITIFRVKDGKLAEEWGVIDMWGLLKQLGLAPPLK